MIHTTLILGKKDDVPSNNRFLNIILLCNKNILCIFTKTLFISLINLSIFNILVSNLLFFIYVSKSFLQYFNIITDLSSFKLFP